MNDNQLGKLPPSELLFLYSHSKLGNQHLRKHLSDEEFNQILHLGNLDERLQSKMEPGKAEIAGDATRVLNTILTTILGGWMGVSSFLGFQLNSPRRFFTILSISLFLGAVIGFQNYVFVKKTTENSIENRLLQSLQIKILKNINAKRKKELKEKLEELNQILARLKIKPLENLQIDVQKTSLGWFEQIKELFKKKNPSIFTFALEEIERIQSQIKEDKQAAPTKESLPLIAKLKRSGLEKPDLSLKNWIKANFRILSISLIPTLFGGFSSLLVYFSGMPNLAKEMGKHEIYDFFNQPHIKIAEVIFAIFTTLYFTYSFLHTNKANFNRDQELHRANLRVIEEETTLADLDDKLLKLKELEQRVLQLEPLLNILNHL